MSFDALEAMLKAKVDRQRKALAETERALADLQAIKASQPKK